MKINNIKREHAELFADMDPLEYLERTCFPDHICLGAFLENEKTGADEPAGLMILRKAPDSLTVEWICVRASNRYNGVGSGLVNRAYELADEMGFDRLCFYQNTDYGRKEICPGENDFIDEYNILEKKELYGEWLCEARSVGKMKFMEIPDVPDLSCKTLRSVSYETGNEFLEESSEDLAILYTPEKQGIRLMDIDTSVFTLAKGKISGALLSQMCGETLFVVGFCATSKQEAAMLIRNFVKNVIKKYGPAQEIRLIKYTGMYSDIANEMLSSGKIENKIYISDTEKYFMARERFVPVTRDELVAVISD